MNVCIMNYHEMEGMVCIPVRDLKINAWCLKVDVLLYYTYLTWVTQACTLDLFSGRGGG